MSSYIQPIFNEEQCKKLNLDPWTKEIEDITHIPKDKLETAPPLKVVWQQFTDFVNKYNYKKSKYNCPIPVGHNVAYDLTIVNRICGEDPYKYGPYDDDRRQNGLFSIFSFDTMILWLYWSENLAGINSVSFDSVREYFGMSNERAHNAEFDVEQTSKFFIRWLKFSRDIAKNTKFKGSFSDTKRTKTVNN